MHPDDPHPVPKVEDRSHRGLGALFRELRRRRVLRTVAWYAGGSAALVQAADVFQQALALPEGTVRFLAVAAVCGLPVALALSWAYDVTAASASWLRHVLVAGVALTSLLIGGVWLGGGPRAEVPVLVGSMPPNRVAILALDAPGASPETEAFATYLHERLIEGLSVAAANVSGPARQSDDGANSGRLRVISRAGTLPFSGGTLTTDSIGRALRAGTLVSGVVEALGGRVRVRLQLIDAASAEVLATRETEAGAGDAVVLVDAVADSLVLMVRQSLGDVVPDRARRLETGSREAFEAFLRSGTWRQEFLDALQVRDLDRASRALEEADRSLALAAELDPRWVEPVAARAMLASGRARLAQASGARDLTEPYARGLEHAEEAVRLDPESALALSARGALRATLALVSGRAPDRRTAALLEGAEDDLRRAAAASPRPADALRRLSEVLAAQERLDEALSYGRRAYVEDPYLETTSLSLLRLFEYSLRLDRDAEAAEWCDEGRRRFADLPIFSDCRLLLMAWTDVALPEPDSAWALVERELGPYPAALRPQLEPRLHALAAAVLARAGKPDSARSVLERALAQDSETGGMHLVSAGVEALLGRPEAALEHAARALDAMQGARASLRSAPELRALRDLPAFQAMAVRR